MQSITRWRHTEIVILNLRVVIQVKKVTDDGKVVKKILDEGPSYEMPREFAKVKIAYEGRLPDGTVFDRRDNETPLEFATGEEETIRGLDLAAQGMKKDERALVKIDPEYGFGAETVEKDGFLAPVPGGV